MFSLDNMAKFTHFYFRKSSADSLLSTAVIYKLNYAAGTKFVSWMFVDEREVGFQVKGFEEVTDLMTYLPSIN